MNSIYWSSKEERRRDPRKIGMIQLAYPILLEYVLRSTVNMIDILFLSRVSDSVVSAVNVSTQYIYLCTILSMSISSGATVCINQAIGMNKRERVNTLASIAVLGNVLLGIIVGLLFVFASRGMLSIMSMQESSIDAAVRYMRIAGGLMIFQCIELVFSNLCRSLGMSKVPLLINLTANTLNVIGNYMAVMHPEITHMDPIEGVAAASIFGYFVGMLVAIAFARRTGVRIGRKYLTPFPWKDVKLVLSICIPGGLNNLAYSLSMLVTTSIITLAGDTILAAKVYASNLTHYIALVGMAFSNAASIMVGYRVGAGNYEEAEYIRKSVTRIAILSNIFFSLVLLAARMPLLRVFTQTKEVLDIAQAVFFIDIVVEIGRALNNSLQGGLQAVGDVRFQLIVNQTSGWVISIGGSYLFGIVLGWGLNGVWFAFALDEMTRGLLLLYRWRSKKWMEGAELRRKVIAGTKEE